MSTNKSSINYSSNIHNHVRSFLHLKFYFHATCLVHLSWCQWWHPAGHICNGMSTSLTSVCQVSRKRAFALMRGQPQQQWTLDANVCMRTLIAGFLRKTVGGLSTQADLTSTRHLARSTASTLVVVLVALNFLKLLSFILENVIGLAKDGTAIAAVVLNRCISSQSMGYPVKLHVLPPPTFGSPQEWDRSDRIYILGTQKRAYDDLRIQGTTGEATTDEFMDSVTTGRHCTATACWVPQELALCCPQQR